MTEQTAVPDLVEHVRSYFDRVHREVFDGDPAANPRLRVEVLGAAMATDTPVLVLVTPWTLNGMAFPPDDDFPEQLTVGDRTYPVFVNEVADFGSYRSLNLIADVSGIESHDAARQRAEELAQPLRDAVSRARAPRSEREEHVADPGRRRLLMPWREEDRR